MVSVLAHHALSGASLVGSDTRSEEPHVARHGMLGMIRLSYDVRLGYGVKLGLHSVNALIVFVSALFTGEMSSVWPFLSPVVPGALE